MSPVALFIFPGVFSETRRYVTIAVPIVRYCQYERERVRSLRQNAFPRKRAERRRRELRKRVKTHVWMLKSGRGGCHVVQIPRASFYYDLFIID